MGCPQPTIRTYVKISDCDSYIFLSSHTVSHAQTVASLLILCCSFQWYRWSFRQTVHAKSWKKREGGKVGEEPLPSTFIFLNAQKIKLIVRKENVPPSSSIVRNFLIIRLLSVIKRCADMLTPNKKGCTELDTTRDSKLLFKCKMSKSKFVEFSKVSNFLLAKTELNH